MDATNSDVPLGLSMALAKNSDAMQIFSSLPKEKQQIIVNMTHSINSKQEMKMLVEQIAYNSIF